RRSPAAAAERFAPWPPKAARSLVQSPKWLRACFASALWDEKQRRAWFDLTILRDGLTSLALVSVGNLEIFLIFVETILNPSWRSGEGVRVIFRFGSYALDAERRDLWRSGKRVALERQVFDILLYLLENRHRVVTRDDVLRAVWRGRVVSESTLSSRFTAVRHAIGDSGARQRLIRPVTRGGYRFVGAVTASRPPGHPAGGSDIKAAISDKASVLIAPLVNLSGDAGQDRFLAGLADELTTALIRFRQFAVIPRSIVPASQVADAARVAAEWGVRYVLHGSFRREGDHVRISAQLTDAFAQTLLWADRYDCRGIGTFELQDRITARLIGAIVPQLEAREHERLKAEPIGQSNAYALTLAGVRSLRQWTKPGIDRALRLFRQAIAADREFAPAYAMSSYCYVQQQSY